MSDTSFSFTTQHSEGSKIETNEDRFYCSGETSQSVEPNISTARSVQAGSHRTPSQPFTSSIARIEIMFFSIAFLLGVILVELLLSTKTSTCLEAPMFLPGNGTLIFHLRGMYENDRYIDDAIWHDATEALKVPAASVLRAAKYHFNTSRDLLGSLEGIQQRMEEVDHAVEAALRMRNDHEWQTEFAKIVSGKADPEKRQEEARQAAMLQHALAMQISTASSQLAAAESELGRLLSNAASARERHGTAIKMAEDQLAAALAYTDNIAGEGDYSIGLAANRLSRLSRVTFFEWFGFSPVVDEAWPQMRPDADNQHVEHTRSAGRKLLEALKQWGPLNQVIKDEWNGIDSRRHEPSWNSEPAHVRPAIAGLLRFLQEYQDNLVKEIALFMETWGPGAGYSWEKVKQHTRLARACGSEAESSGRDSGSWIG